METKGIRARGMVAPRLPGCTSGPVAGDQQFIGDGDEFGGETGRSKGALDDHGPASAHSIALHGGIPPHGAHFNRNPAARLGRTGDEAATGGSVCQEARILRFRSGREYSIHSKYPTKAETVAARR